MANNIGGLRSRWRRDGVMYAAARTVRESLDRFVNTKNLAHEIAVISISYLFVFVGAWNDSLIGLPPSKVARIAEASFALALLVEIIARVRFSRQRGMGFWALLCLDFVSILTVVPALKWFAFARLARMVYASARVVYLVDWLARRTGNAFYLLVLYPIIIPLAAAMLYAFEKGSPQTPVHNYIEALITCFTFALSLGNIRPATTVGMTICGTLFLLGIVCIGIVSNGISSRYGYAVGKKA